MDVPVNPRRTRTTTELVALHRRYGANHYAQYPIVMCHGRDVYLWDLEGRRYIDMNGTYSAIAVGHAHPELVEVIATQAGRIAGVQNALMNEHAPVLEEQLCLLTGQEKVVLMNSGAEAFDTAVKIARRWAYRVKSVPDNTARIIGAQDNFHGRTIAALAASSMKKYREDFGPFPDGFDLVPFGDLEALEKAITPETAAFIVEPIQGEGGINLPPEGYLCAVRELCTRHNILLGFDEIQTGFGRTGTLFAFEQYGVKPDLIMLGKALGEYIAVSAVAGKASVIGQFTHGSHGSTFAGTALPCAVARKSIELITRDHCALVRNARLVGAYARDRLSALLAGNPNVLEVRGRGLLIGIALDPRRALAEEVRGTLLQKHRIVAGAASNNVLRFSPPLTFTREHADKTIPKIVRALKP